MTASSSIISSSLNTDVASISDTTNNVVENVLPTFLTFAPNTNIVICKSHGTGFTYTKLDRHLRRVHRIDAQARRKIFQHPSIKAIACRETDIEHPPDGSDQIVSLPIHQGFICHFSDCDHRTINIDAIRQHYNQTHQWRRRRGDSTPWLHASLQTLSASFHRRRYFAVRVPHLLVNGEPNSQRYIFESASSSTVRSDTSIPSIANWEELNSSFQSAQASQNERYQRVTTAHHVSELTPWLRRTGIFSHFQHIEVALLADTYRLPDPAERSTLNVICHSIERVIQNLIKPLAHDRDSETPTLSRSNARRLNTFRRGETSQDPIVPLQEKRTLEKYIRQWQHLVCYFERVVDHEQLSTVLFTVTEHQARHWDLLKKAADDLLQLESTSISDENHLTLEHCKEEVDKQTLHFSLSILQHRLEGRVFDSVLVSFAAVMYWNPISSSWLALGNYTPILSALIYVSQMLLLGLAMELQKETGQKLGELIETLRDQWQLNDVDSPMAELLENRLLASKIARQEVTEAKVRWNRDGLTLVHQEIVLPLSDISQLIWTSLAEARRIFETDLCLGFPQIPEFDVQLLRDNWDASSPGESFLTDGRNHPILKPAELWLLTQLFRSTERMNIILQRDPTGGWHVDVDALEEYEYSIQRFLEALVTPFLLGSGQLARRAEFLGLRWCNSMLQKRNLFIHDGRLVYILTYHKSINLTNASKWPARFLLPEVASLTVQFLALVIPFCRWLRHSSGQKGEVSEYLWSRKDDPWPKDHLTAVIASAGRAWIGQNIHLRAWRQITIAIAIKKFAALSQFWTEAALETDDPEIEAQAAGSMPNVFHHQAAHTPHTGNQAYGGSVNFRRGLTDAGLQEFLRASETWHVFLRDPVGFDRDLARAEAARRVRSIEQTRASVTSHTQVPLPLLRRMTLRGTRATRKWVMSDAEAVLRRMYGAHAQFTSHHQRQALTHIVEGNNEIVAVLRTGAGKSLLYILPSQLPGAGTTVVVLPLVVLKQEMERRCRLSGIEFYIWGADNDLDPDQLRCPLLFVSIDQAVQPRFRTVLNQLHMADALDRIVVDECHLILTAVSYRPRLRELQELRRSTCQFVFLTGTLPPEMIPQFEHAALLSRPRLIRGPTLRSDLRYSVEHTPGGQPLLGELTTGAIRGWLEGVETGCRAIIYCRTRSDANEISSTLGCPVYYSDSGTAGDKELVLKAWQEGASPVVAATSAFGLGVDQGQVRLVIHLGAPDSLIDFAQETGRLGRDGLGGRSVVIRAPAWQARRARHTGAILPPEEVAMLEFLEGPRCRLQIMSRFLDGVEWSCDPGDPRCDLCHTRTPSPVVEHGPSPVITAESSRDSTGSSDVESLVDISSPAGKELLEEREQHNELSIRRYQDHLHTLRGVCMLCKLLPTDSPNNTRHAMGRCSNRRRFAYFEAHKKARSTPGGWFAPYTACFRCYNPQQLCSQKGGGACQYQDLIMPACWAAFQLPPWGNVKLPDLAGRPFQDEAEYMRWLGHQRHTHGIRASNAMYIADHVFQSITE